MFGIDESSQGRQRFAVVQSLEAAMWAFARGSDFRSGALLAVNLGDQVELPASRLATEVE